MLVTVFVIAIIAFVLGCLIGRKNTAPKDAFVGSVVFGSWLSILFLAIFSNLYALPLALVPLGMLSGIGVGRTMRFLGN